MKSTTLKKTKITLISFVTAVFLASAGAVSALSSTLSPGSSGSAVSELQTFLAADSSLYPEGLVTGYYGSLTTAAVQRFQCKQGIVCDGNVATTGYGRVGPLTLAKIQAQQGGGTSMPPPGADVGAPIISAPTVATTSTSATIHWTTNEPARSRVMYSTSQPAFSVEAFNAMPNVLDSTIDMSSDVTLAGLTPNTRYYYILESTDLSGNLQWSMDHWLTTNP